jgi:O-antigen/teichoic acid export membrane protein
MIPFIIQAKKKFLLSIVADNSLYFFRLAFMLFFMLVYGMTVNNSMFSYALGGILGSIAGIFLLGYGFLRSKPDIKIFKKLLHFSGWIGVNRIITSISGRLDIQMLVIMAGTSATGLYSIPARLAGFVTVLAGSFSGVLATRLAGFKDKDTEKEYLVKATYALLAITGLLFLWIIIAKPFILVLFGDKYLESVPIFQALIFSMIPFMLTVVPVTAIIYAMKKTKYIGLFSFFQIVAIFFLNLYLIPIYGPIGPTISLGLVNLILAIYTWAIVINYYWGSK